MTKVLATDPSVFMTWTWVDFEPFYADLQATALTAQNVDAWLAAWSKLTEVVSEYGERLQVAKTQNTADEDIEKRFFAYLETISQPAQSAEQALKEKLLASGLQPAGLEIMLRNLRGEVDLFRDANIPLATELSKIGTEYDKLIGAMTITWNGEEKTMDQVGTIYTDPDRATREKAWRMAGERRLQDSEKIGDLWVKAMDIRKKMATNADLPTFRDYQWRRMARYDYTPADCERFHDAIEQVVVPAAERMYERRKKALGVDTLRPWDLFVETSKEKPLAPYTDIAEFEAGTERILTGVDPVLGGYFSTMRKENALDLPNRKNKAAGGYCTQYSVARRPFIFMNAVGLHDDVQTLLHEAGHAFHVFESAVQPYAPQRDYPIEFAEVASMSMELLAQPYLSAKNGGFYTEVEAKRATVEHLEGMIKFWPYMAVMDAFQHWVYSNHEIASDPANCDAKWLELWDRFMRGVDMSGLGDLKLVGWQGGQFGWRFKLHIHRYPFYYVEYGLAQLGAAQVWRGSLTDQAGAVAKYRAALAFGGTKPLPELFVAAGAKLAFDAQTLGSAVDLLRSTVERLTEEIAAHA